MLSSRFLLVPMYLGLIIAMLAYDWAFMKELWEMSHGLLSGAAEHTKEFLLVGVLGLLDSAMIANLIVMIMIGSHSIFVREIKADSFEKGAMPRFLIGLTSGILKVKMGSSLVSVSSIHLLTAFMNTEHNSWEELSKKLLIHFAFITSAYVFCVMETKMHPPELGAH